jgi:hypothetical protein
LPGEKTSNGVLGLRASATSVRGIGVTRELDGVVVLELESCLESLSNLEESILALLGSPALALACDGATDGSRPETNAVEASPHVDNYTHDLVVILIFEVLANGGEHDVEPECVDVDRLLVLELKRPLAAMLVL